MIDFVYALRLHGSSSYVTNLNLGFQIAERMHELLNGENWKSVGCVLAKLHWLVEMCPIIDVLYYVATI